MADLPHPWDVYKHVQDELDLTSTVTSNCWGMEAALDAVIRAAAVGQAITVQDAHLCRESSARRERRHCAAVAKLVPVVEAGSAASSAVAALTIEEIDRRFLPRDRALLRLLAAGQTYGEVARVDGRRAGALRVRVSRIRAQLGVVTPRRSRQAGAALTKRPRRSNGERH